LCARGRPAAPPAKRPGSSPAPVDRQHG
jgi:hypothetical protein